MFLAIGSNFRRFIEVTVVGTVVGSFHEVNSTICIARKGQVFLEKKPISAPLAQPPD
jgi:hypothetical protein